MRFNPNLHNLQPNIVYWYTSISGFTLRFLLHFDSPQDYVIVKIHSPLLKV